MTKDEKARAAATQWCRCHKCDGIAYNQLGETAVKFECNKDKLQTCHKWYNGYRTAQIALDGEETPKKRWRANINDVYYFIDADGEIRCRCEQDGSLDYGLYALGNYFQNAEDAEIMANQFKKLMQNRNKFIDS